MCDGHVLGEPLKLAHATACRAGRLFISPSSLAVCTIHFPEWFILYVSYSSIFPCSVQEQILQYGSSIIVRSFIANALELALFSSLLRYVAFLAVHRLPASHTCQTPNSNTVGICCAVVVLQAHRGCTTATYTYNTRRTISSWHVVLGFPTGDGACKLQGSTNSRTREGKLLYRWLQARA